MSLGNVQHNRARVLRGGTVVDGTGAARFVADVRIEGERIAAIGAHLDTQDSDVLDVAGKMVAPGFIDVHTHDDQILLAAPQMLPKISQGVTTVVIGNCGISLAPLVHADVPPPLNLLGSDKYVYPTMAAYVAALGETRPAVNVAALVGHSTLRVATMDDPYRSATPAEQSRMVELLREGMDAGATGLSSGVFYATGAAADVDEVPAAVERTLVVEALVEHDWLAGPMYSLADVAFTPYLARLEHLNILEMIGERHRVAHWYRRCKARPSFHDAIVKWENADYLGLMQRRGAETWPQVQAIMQAL